MNQHANARGDPDRLVGMSLVEAFAWSSDESELAPEMLSEIHSLHADWTATFWHMVV